MNTKHAILSIVTGLIFVSSGLAQSPTYFMHNGLKFLWETENKLEVPESVCYDEDRDLLYISNISGNPTEKDQNGFISRVSLNGEIKDLKWVEGLNAPKGMGITGGYLYVTDIDRVHKIDLESGTVEQTFTVDEAKFLNDIAVRTNGEVYISDMVTSKIYRIKNNQIALWLSDEKLNRTNGLFTTANYLYIGMADRIIRTSYTAKNIENYIQNTVGIDGLEHYQGDSFLFSDWQGRVFIGGPDQKPVKVLDTRSVKKNAADIEYSKTYNMLFVPTFSANTVAAYEVSAIP